MRTRGARMSRMGMGAAMAERDLGTKTPEQPLNQLPGQLPEQPPDHAERRRALDPTRSFLVQAPAGSGKTYLLTQRFLRLLNQAERPDEIVAITFTNAAAAEMRNRILDALERAEAARPEPDDGPDGGNPDSGDPDSEPDSLAALARRALDRSKLLGWQLLDQPGQLRITTIDAFCRGLALQSPLSWGLLSGLGGTLETADKPRELYRRAATRTLERLADLDLPGRRSILPVRQSIEALLLWRDNNWKDLENQIVEMLAQRNRWHQEFVLARENDWEALRRRLEAPFRRDLRRRLEAVCRMLHGLPGCCDHALELARSACETVGRFSPLSLAERAEMPASFAGDEDMEAALLEDAASAYRDLANFLLTKEGEWRKRLTVNEGFPPTPEGRALKGRMAEFLESLAEEPGLAAALAAFQRPTPAGYTEEEWELIRHCFAVLRVAAGELQVVFAETGSVDFVEVAQIALRILAPENGYPSDFALRQADGIRHLLIDEFQDTSRNQHQLLSRLIAAWPDYEGRSCFCVGDPMQSIYGFREAEVELFERVKTHGLEIAGDAAQFGFEFVQLRANFRTAPSLVEDLNGYFERVFLVEDPAESVRFSAAMPVRERLSSARVELHLAFTNSRRGVVDDSPASAEPGLTRREQLGEMVALIQSRLRAMARVRAEQETHPAGVDSKYRIAVLGRTRSSLVQIAEALRAAKIGFRAIDLVELRERPEVVDVLMLARALMNPVDRTAWLGLLRAPWCGLSLEELHLLVSGDDREIVATPVPVLLAGRLAALYEEGRIGEEAFAAASRVGRVMHRAVEMRPEAAGSAFGASLGTWLESVWKALGGDDTVDDEQRQNLRRLWDALDRLLEGEVDLLGAGLDAALGGLYALPDPAASSDYGVQLMTIHKSKGLEFEVVILPDLEAEGKKGEQAMISWLERGLTGGDPDDDDSGQTEEDAGLTEFLIAPFQSKGTEAGAAKQWVDRVKRERERQELRRLLYVAATRAREEVHLFARPRFAAGKSKTAAGGLVLGNPCGLLATAWPALGDEVEAEFAAWVERRGSAELERREEVLETLAAEGGKVLAMPAPRRPTLLRRLPEGYAPPEFPRWDAGPDEGALSGILSGEGEAARGLYARTEGGLRSRLEGIAIHAFLEELSRLRRSMSHAEAARAVEEALPGVVAMIRSRGLPLAAAEKLVGEALAVAQRTLMDPAGGWILTPHAHADAELRWTGLVRGAAAREDGGLLRNLRPDRVFFAAGGGASGGAWWIIDYKTSHAAGTNLSEEVERERFLRTHREQHVEQLMAYAQLLRGLRGRDPEGRAVAIGEVRAGIYYPRLQLFDHWLA
jgi:ATP-dependent helicase/nuclease subunit A